MRQSEKPQSTSTIPWKELLSFLGLVLVAYIGYLGVRSQAEIPIQATQTAEAKLTLAAQTNIASTSVALSTMTPIISNINGLQLSPFSAGCINSVLWTSLDGQTSKQSSNCLSLDQSGFFAKDGGLTISSTNISGEKIRQGIFTPIENGTKISLKLTIPNLYTPHENDLANLSFGVISTSSLNLETDTLLVYQKESPQDGYPIFMKSAERGGYADYLSQNGDYRKYTKNTTQEILLDISDTNQLTIYIDGLPVIQTPLPLQNKVFWIGYRLSENCQINAEISDFQILSK